MHPVPLVEVVRGTQVESIHYGSVAVVDARGTLLAHAGDPAFMAFTRSILKPFQALPFLRSGGPRQFAYGDAEIALMCASHSGEARHVGIVAGMLEKAGCDEQHLRCGCHVPLCYSVREQAPSPDAHFTQLHNNCSGKHAGFLAYCVQHELPTESYLDPDHPLQKEIRATVAACTGLDANALPIGIDGCSAPNYAMPLASLATLYAGLARHGNHDNEEEDCAPPNQAGYGTLYRAMTGFPELVSGVGRGDLALMQTAPGDWVAKAGAEGVQALGLRTAGLGIAIKMVDGSGRGLLTATVSVLRQLGVLKEPDASPLAAYVRPPIKNLMGVPVGDIRAVVRLRR